MGTPLRKYCSRANFLLELVLVLIMSAVALPVHAQSLLAGLPSEESFFGDIPLVMSASRLKQSREAAPVSVSVIDRRMIEASGYTEIADLFRLIPGFIVGYDRAHTPVVGYLFLENFLSRRMQVLVDGRSIYTPTLGGPVWSTLPVNINDIERIEVIRGSNGASYGSNSVLGVISIITREPGLDDGLMVRSNIGSDGLVEGTVRGADSIGNFDFRLTAWYQENDGFEQRYDTTGVDRILVDSHDGKQLSFLNGEVDYRPSRKDTISLSAGYSDGHYQQEEPQDIFTPKHERLVQSKFQMLKWQHIVNETEEFHLQFYHNFDGHIEEMVLSGDIAPMVTVSAPYDQNYTSERYDLEFQHTITPTHDLHLAWGLSAREDSVDSSRYIEGGAKKIRTDRIFLNASWDVNPDTIISGGVLFEDNEITGNEVSSLLSLNYRLDPEKTVRLSAARASRLPVALEQYPDWKIDIPPFGTEQFIYNAAEVSAEMLTTYEIGLIGKIPHHRLTYDVSYSLYRLDDLIGIVDDPDFPDLGLSTGSEFIDNIGELELKSFEASLSYAWSADSRLVASFANIDIQGSNAAVEKDFGRTAPENIFSLMVMTRPVRDWSFSAIYYFLDRIQGLGTNQLNDPVRKLDIRGAYHFKTAGLDGERSVLARLIDRKMSVLSCLHAIAGFGFHALAADHRRAQTDRCQ